MTITELARLAGVSVSTVSKIMNNKDSSISSETREHVMRLAKEYNYTPYASVLGSQVRTLAIGVILSESSHSGTLISGILEASSKRGYSVLLRQSHRCAKEELKNINGMLSLHVDGILWEPVSEQQTEPISLLRKSKIPCLIMDSSGSLTSVSDSSTASPILDFSLLGYQVTEILIRNGHTEIACLLRSGRRSTSFLEGYRRCLFDHGLPFNEDWIFQGMASLPSGKITGHAFSGIVSSHYTEALLLYQTVEQLHYSIPYDLSVISLKDDVYPKSSYPPISTLTIPHEACGREIAERLICLLEKSEPVSRAALPLSLDHEHSIQAPYRTQLKRVLSLGSINIDNYLNFETLPRSGKTMTSPSSRVYPGGKGINEAIGAAKLGHHVALIGRVGNDADGDLIYSAVNALQIDTSGLSRSRDFRTGQAYIFVQRDGESMISIMSGANNTVTSQDILDNERLFSNGGYCLMQTEIPMSAIVQAAALAKKHGLITVLKPSACSLLPRQLLEQTDILVPNAEELDEICQTLCPHLTTPEEKAEFFLQMGVRTVIITLGAQGCLLCEPNRRLKIPAADFVSVDSSGAGDAFISALVSYLLYGHDMEHAARIATYAAGLSTTRQGTSSALVDRNTLEAYILRVEPELLQ